MTTQIKDILIDNRFNFRFIFDEEKNEWVCKMPSWLLAQAESVFNRDKDLAEYQQQAAQLWNDSCTSNRSIK